MPSPQDDRVRKLENPDFSVVRAAPAARPVPEGASSSARARGGWGGRGACAERAARYDVPSRET
ncbi:hypothetical protein GCM10010358_44450 [Streptomyces minutiscleroticus]|uniref:Uncharacterized protein n=1 Tax=Streptomyces minutiscleroticus TaxID=68238 RepID=A0A918NPI6_9ACTN|nr:hypothetical protein GCM10010358_44450 [Streptomyces minutiscleroticus]